MQLDIPTVFVFGLTDTLKRLAGLLGLMDPCVKTSAPRKESILSKETILKFLRKINKFSSYPRYYAEASKEWRGPLPRHSVLAALLQRNVAAVASSWRRCVPFYRPRNRTQDFPRRLHQLADSRKRTWHTSSRYFFGLQIKTTR